MCVTFLRLVRKISPSFEILFQMLSLSLLLCSGTQANDTTARVGAGGIALVKNNDIRLVQEVLEISTKSVKVQYLFLNESDHDVRTTVAFPMPLYGWNNGELSVNANERPLESFKAWINGEPVQVASKRAARRGDTDITNRLREIGLSEEQIFETFGDCDVDHGCGLAEEKINKVDQLFGKNSYFPQWKISETLYWEQLFPRKEGVVVGHQYVPFKGYVFNYPRDIKWFDQEFMPIPSSVETSGKGIKEACINDGLKKELLRKVKAKEKAGADPSIFLQDVEYILGTGGNWKGKKIGDFRLRIVKDSPDQFVSLCFPGKPTKLTPTLVEFHQQDYVPQETLVIYFIDVL